MQFRFGRKKSFETSRGARERNLQPVINYIFVVFKLTKGNEKFYEKIFSKTRKRRQNESKS